ncbi:unnamed protein product [Larinioides sclopetarius]|uniref:Uncharacterized protein n=1 Tax=Larinioides sclopetarius TaxID=280406 RepID=A0AAV2BSZ6_9ARAC
MRKHVSRFLNLGASETPFFVEARFGALAALQELSPEVKGLRVVLYIYGPQLSAYELAAGPCFKSSTVYLYDSDFVIGINT